MREFLTNFKLLSVVVLLTFLGDAHAAKYKSYEIKAVYLYKIANFVKWPDEENRSQLNFCFRGNLDVQRTFLKLTEKKRIRGLQLTLGESERQCDLIFISDRFSSDQFSNAQLVIGDKKGFVKKGGFMELSQRKGKIHPVINSSKVKQSDLKISSKLMKIATLVKEQG